MNEAFDAGFEFDERAEVCGARDYSANTLAHFVLSGAGVPRMGLELLQADGDAALTVFFRGLEDLDFDLLADGEDVRGLLDARPADFTDVQQGIDAAEVDERAVIGEAADDTGDSFAVGEFGIAAVAGSVGFFFSDGAVIDDDIFFGDVELGNAAADFLANELFHLGGIARAAAGGGHKGADSYVNAEAAFHDGRDGAENGHPLGECLLQRRPVRGTLDAGPREFVIAFFIAAFDGDQELVARFHFLAGALKKRERKNAFGLIADVEEDRVGGDGDNRSLELFCAFGLVGVGLLVLSKEIAE